MESREEKTPYEKMIMFKSSMATNTLQLEQNLYVELFCILIHQIFYKGEKESKLSEGYGVFQVATLKEKVPPVELPLARIKRALTTDEYKTFMQDEQNKLPGKIKLFDGDKVELPPDQLVAGEKLKWVSVALYDRSRQAKLVGTVFHPQRY